MTFYNASISGLPLASVSPDALLWGITIMVFIGTISAVFLAFRYFSALVYGFAVSGIIALIGWYSHDTASNAVSGDYGMLIAWCWIIGFIIVSVMTGLILQRLKLIKKFEAKFK